MAALVPIQPIKWPQADIAKFGQYWLHGGEKFTRKQSMDFGGPIDTAVANALAQMLGSIPIATPSSTVLLPSSADEVELGHFRVIGGVRPQNFDVGYRPDGVRIAFDSKTLNDRESIRKNYQNMINDLATEATTVHTRFPYAIVSFLVALPEPALEPVQERALIGTLERMTARDSPLDLAHKAEAISVVLWNPQNGTIDCSRPDPTSPLRLEAFARQMEAAYVSRYKGLPPHDT